MRLSKMRFRLRRIGVAGYGGPMRRHTTQSEYLASAAANNRSEPPALDPAVAKFIEELAKAAVRRENRDRNPGT
jgi:hypothetical protein